ncbi:threonine-phosphate decarboxylase [Aliikangiella sp. G2MR2-5]|uniref:threonine-phosphate decarboxylase n=1 Tax=Aliikangiella sp. G2MR2-5 TaxID=2788943 RepID=UPI0018AAC7D2
MALTHGGQLSNVAAAFGLDEEGWLDLSTGISPYPFPYPEPIPSIADNLFRDLPQVSAEFCFAASNYYGTKDLLVTAGSQPVIAALPSLLLDENSSARIFIPEIGYKEHEFAWKKASVEVCFYRSLPSIEQLQEKDLVLVINPNNPGCDFYEPELLEEYLRRLGKLNGKLIVDEAFIDARVEEGHSMIRAHMPEALVVLRSVGKFFGLAGLRVGFVAANRSLLQKINELLGPWSVNGPALKICELALTNREWQVSQRKRIRTQREKLIAILTQYFASENIRHGELFVTVKMEVDKAAWIFEALAKQKIYIRLCDEKDCVRFGLATDVELQRLEKALSDIG